MSMGRLMYRVALMVSVLPLLLAVGCGSGAESNTAQPQAVEGPTCMPNVARPCPCLAGGMGMQLCSAAGDGFGPCTGCPPRVPEGPAAGTDPLLPPDNPSTQAPMAMLTGMMGTMMPDLGSPDGSTGSLELDGGAMEDDSLNPGVGGPDAGLDDAAIDDPPPEVGTSCGVGLPITCELGSQKCCVRSLMTDSCIDATASCDCSLSNCSTLEAHCDGPEDCDDGQVCCGTLQGNTYVEFTCEANCDYRGGQRIACHQVEPDCPNGTVCANSQLLTNLQVCIDPSTIEQ